MVSRTILRVNLHLYSVRVSETDNLISVSVWYGTHLPHELDRLEDRERVNEGEWRSTCEVRLTCLSRGDVSRFRGRPATNFVDGKHLELVVSEGRQVCGGGERKHHQYWKTAEANMKPNTERTDIVME